jgi:hypothetical protein
MTSALSSLGVVGDQEFRAGQRTKMRAVEGYEVSPAPRAVLNGCLHSCGKGDFRQGWRGPEFNCAKLKDEATRAIGGVCDENGQAASTGIGDRIA